MSKKLIKHGNNFALIIDEETLKSLGISEGTSLEMLVILKHDI